MGITKKYGLLWLALYLLMSSCSQLSSFQTGKTLGKNKVEIGGAALVYTLREDIYGSLNLLPLPHSRLWMQYGLAEKLDLGLSGSTGGNITLNTKWQFVGDASSKWAASLGANTEYQLTDELAGVLRFHAPVYGSFHPNEKMAYYVTPRYVLQYVKNDDNNHFLGSALGVQTALSNSWLLSFETGLHYLITHFHCHSKHLQQPHHDFGHF